ncbi:MAG TPA: hypothetical protein PKC91_13560 [Ignavibacteria bacterium]|nr:hypothetical protein [Ignavibacteria bacterium]
MIKSSVLEILKTFSNKELDSFEDFLLSPYFNKIKNVIKLYSEIKKYAPGFDSPDLAKEIIWKKIFPGKVYKYGTMKNLIHELSKLGEKFITQETYNKNSMQEFSNLYVGLFSRKLFRIIGTKDTYINKKFKDSEIHKYRRDASEYYYHMTNVYLYKMYKNHFLDMKDDLSDDRYTTGEIYACSTIVNLILVHSIVKTFEVNDKKAHPELNVIELILAAIPDATYHKIFEHIKKKSEIKYIILHSHYLSYKALINKGSIDDYLNYKNFLLNNSHPLPNSSLRNLTALLDNVLYFVSSSDFDKQKDLLEIYEFKVSRNIFLHNNDEISGGVFIYWAKIFFSEMETAKFEEFIRKYGKNIVEKDRESTLFLANAQMLFMKDEFEKSLSELSKINFDVFELKIVMKKLQLMIYYELDEYEAYLTSYDSYKHFLKNVKFIENNLREIQKIRAKDFFDGINLMFKLKSAFNDYTAKKLYKDIKGKNYDHKKWFLRKLEELKVKNRM